MHKVGGEGSDGWCAGGDKGGELVGKREREGESFSILLLLLFYFII